MSHESICLMEKCVHKVFTEAGHESSMYYVHVSISKD